MPLISFDHEEFVVDYRMGLFHRCLGHMESLLDQEFRQWDNAVQERIQTISDEQGQQHFLDYVSEEFAERSEFGFIVLNSFFAASFAEFEHRLFQLCYRAQKDSNSGSSVDDVVSGSRMDKADKYLSGLGVPFPGETNLWKEIKNYRDIRNRIMHEGGRIRLNEDLHSYARKQNIISPNDGLREIRLTQSFCEQSIDNMRNFLIGAMRRYDQWLKEQSDKQRGE